jgi:hypothetical protein
MRSEARVLARPMLRRAPRDLRAALPATGALQPRTSRHSRHRKAHGVAHSWRTHAHDWHHDLSSKGSRFLSSNQAVTKRMLSGYCTPEIVPGVGIMVQVEQDFETNNRGFFDSVHPKTNRPLAFHTAPQSATRLFKTQLVLTGT